MTFTTGSARIDRGERPVLTTHELLELAKARTCIRQLESEVEIFKRAAKLPGKDRPDLKGLIEVIDQLVDAGHPVKVCCRLLGVSSPGYYQYMNCPLSPTAMRR